MDSDYNTHHIILITSSQNQRVGTIITPSMNTSYMWPVDARFTDLENQLFHYLKKIIIYLFIYFFNKQVTSNHICMTNLNSELPLGANRDTWDGAIVIGGNDGALLSSTNTGHSLKRGRGTHYFYL